MGNRGDGGEIGASTTREEKKGLTKGTYIEAVTFACRICPLCFESVPSTQMHWEGGVEGR
jgi:hypothetical protein